MADPPVAAPARVTVSGQDVLLATKLHVPGPPPGFVPRPRLAQTLGEGLARGRVLVRAPAGSGKTELLADWARGGRRPVAWLGLDAGDSDPARFWRYAVAALDRARPGLAERVGPPAPGSSEGLVTALINELAADPGPDEVLLVLDDYHLVDPGPVHESVAFLLENLPPGLRVVVSSRADPPLPLARLRARGQLAELRAADLRFTDEEAADLLAEAAGPGLPTAAVAALVARTEGWAAGLQLAGLSLRGRADAAGFVAAFSGSHRFVLDYLADEVLDGQPGPVRAFLLETSVLERLSGELCDAVTGRPGSQAMLADVERAGLFLVPLDEVRGWWRYHQLFADLLRARLAAEQPSRALALHRAAAAWCEEHDLADDAVRHALAAGDATRAARLVERHVETLLGRSEGATLRRWLSALPAESVRDRPRLCLAQAYTAAQGFQLEALEALLDDAERAFAASGDEPYEDPAGRPASVLANVPAAIAFLRASLARLRGDAALATGYNQQALAQLGEDDWLLRSFVRWNQALADWLDGRLGPAERDLAEVLAELRAAADEAIRRAGGEPAEVLRAVEGGAGFFAGFLAMRVCYDLGQVQRARGHLDAAQATYRNALATAGESSQPRHLGLAHVGLAQVLYEREELTAAHQHPPARAPPTQPTPDPLTSQFRLERSQCMFRPRTGPRGAGWGCHNGQVGVTDGLVTLLFTDIEGSVRLWEADRDAMAAASAHHDRIVREQIETSGGHVFKTMGEAHRAVFADPVAALSSAVAIQRVVGAEPWASSLPIRVCMALHSGSCAERDGDYVGPVVNRTARLLDIGHGGQVLATAAAYALLADRLPGGIGLRDLGEQRLKDLGRAERVFQVTGSGLAEGFGVLRSLDDPALRHNLPSQVTSFVGRTVELAELRALVSGGSRLVTIAGPGGIGKSRLTLQVAADALDGTGDGVWLAELAPVAEPELVTRTAAAALRVSEAPGRPMLDTLTDAIGDRDLLMILDNAEQVLGAVAELADAVIRSCPGVCLLVTSREPLGISGEHVFRVSGLTVPPADLAAPDRLAAFESVQLFAEHAALHQRGFTLDDANAAAVATICVRLDGIPLALELAAARLGSLSASEINARLDQRFRLLTTGNRTALPRHQTLRALIDWSYDLLSSEEQIVFGRLSVFAGGWTLDAAEAVVSGGDVAEWQVLDLLAGLVGKSLVQAEVLHGSTRYRLLETIRHYAAERLALRAGSDLQDARVAHRDHYVSLVETAAARMRGPDEHRWLDRIEAEFDNVRAALAFSIADPGSAEPGLRLAAGLRTFVFSRGHSVEVMEALGALLGRPDARQPTRYLVRALVTNCKLLTHFDRSPDIPSMAEEAITIARGLHDDGLAADALAALNWFSFLKGDLPAALARADEAVALARAAGSPTPLVVALGHRAVFKAETGDLDASLADYQEVLSLARASGDNYTLVVTLVNLGVDQVTAGEFPAALAYLQDALRVADAHGYQHLSAAAEMNLGFAYLMNGDAAGARRLLVGVLDRARAAREMTWVRNALLGLALSAGADADPAVAATLHGAADHEYEQAGQAFDVKESKMRTGDHARLRDAMGEAAFDAAYQHGRTLSQADAIALAVGTAQPDPGLALAVTVPALHCASADSPAGPLSARERQIMALLAGGASDARIAETLFVTTNTVRTHLDRIRDKTGARNRAELTRYAIQAGIEPVVPSP